MRESIGKTNGRYNTKNNTYGYNEKRRHIVRPNSILYHCNDSTSTKTYKKEHNIILSILPSSL